MDDSDGTIRVWDPKTRAFAAYNRDGTTRTYFKPGSPDYFERQPGRLDETETERIGFLVRGSWLADNDTDNQKPRTKNEEPRTKNPNQNMHTCPVCGYPKLKNRPVRAPAAAPTKSARRAVFSLAWMTMTRGSLSRRPASDGSRAGMKWSSRGTAAPRGLECQEANGRADRAESRKATAQEKVPRRKRSADSLEPGTRAES